MTITVEGKIVKGQLRCTKPIVLAEGTPVRVTITPVQLSDDPYADIIGICHSGRKDGAANHDKYIKRRR